MSRRLSVGVFLLLCFTTTEARAGPWQAHPVRAAGEKRASDQDESIGSAADYIQTLVRPVTISGIGASVRDGQAKLFDGHEVSGAEVIDVTPAGPAALAGIQPAARAAKAVLAAFIGKSDVIFAADGERIRNTLDLADRVQSLAPGEWIYLTMARRGRRVQICVTASP